MSRASPAPAGSPGEDLSSAAVHAEHGHHGVADELLDDATVRLDVLVPAQEVGVDDGADILGVELLGQHGEVDEVGEQDRDELALLGDCPVDQRRSLGEQRREGRVDHRVSEYRAALRARRWQGRSPPDPPFALTLTATWARLLAVAGLRAEREHRSDETPDGIVGRRAVAVGAGDAGQRGEGGAERFRGLAQPEVCRQSAPAAASARTPSTSAADRLRRGLGPRRQHGELALVEIDDAASPAAEPRRRAPRDGSLAART